jgi:hypothetical protein
MLQAVKARDRDLALAWKLDPITRRIRDFARLRLGALLPWARASARSTAGA